MTNYHPTTANDAPAVPDVTTTEGRVVSRDLAEALSLAAHRARNNFILGEHATPRLRECARELGSLLKSCGLTWGDVLPTEPCQECGVETHTLTAGTDGLRRCRDCVRDRLERLNRQIDFSDPPRGRRCEPHDRAGVLDQAHRAVYARGDQHGTPSETFPRIGHLWSNILQRRVEPHEVAQCMIALKLVRCSVDPANPDNWVDIAGWSACGAEVAPIKRSSGDES